MSTLDDKQHRKKKRTRLDGRPSALLHDAKTNNFIVGTYELISPEEARKIYPDLIESDIEAQLREVNQRFGSLHIFHGQSDYETSSSVKCSSGGVFDMKLRDYIEDEPSSLLAAHANGCVGSYTIIGDQISENNVSPRLVKSQTDLLTSLDCFREQEKLSCDIVAIGDSSGHLHIITENESNPSFVIISETNICDDPVWQVRWIPQRSPTDSNVYILVGAENSCWYVYRFDLRKATLDQLYKNNDFQAGVTSFWIGPILKNSMFTVRIIIGSYDETLVEYDINIHENQTLKTDRRASIRVAGAGIWRIESRPRSALSAADSVGDKCDTLNLATMYAKPVTIAMKPTKDSEPSSSYLTCCSLKQIDLDEKTFIATNSTANRQDPLYYGFMQSINGTSCIIDFNNRECIFVYATS